MDLGVSTQVHLIARAGLAAEPGDQLVARENAIRQKRDRTESAQELIRLLQQSDRDRGTDAGTGMRQRLSQQRDRPVLGNH